jgi:hypothetical protein
MNSQETIADILDDSGICRIVEDGKFCGTVELKFQNGTLVSVKTVTTTLPKTESRAEEARRAVDAAESRSASMRSQIEKAIQDILKDGPQRNGFVHGQLREIYGITSPKIIDEVSADMVQRRVLRKTNYKGAWVWERANRVGDTEMFGG